MSLALNHSIVDMRCNSSDLKTARVMRYTCGHIIHPAVLDLDLYIPVNNIVRLV